MLLSIVCKNAGGMMGSAIGNMIVPGVGGIIGKQIGKALGNAYAGIAGDPSAWAGGIAHSAECIRTLGFDPFDFL